MLKNQKISESKLGFSLKEKRSGVLMHITSLPSEYFIGDLGKNAYRFIDFLEKSRQAFWQVLPLNYVSADKKFSPYAASSAFAGNILLISPDILADDCILKKEDLDSFKNIETDEGNTDFRLAEKNKLKILKTAYKNIFYDSTPGNMSPKLKIKESFEEFCLINNSLWLDDFACFIVFKNYYRKKYRIKSWADWPEEIRDRQKDKVPALKEALSEKIKMEKFNQFLFFHQWERLRNYANRKNIKIIGDIPIYIDFESSDVWKNPDIFKLGADKKPLYVAGVPPDYFSSDGQLWKNPVYDWKALKKLKFNWWIRRIRHCLNLFDVLRIDHFRGFISYWEVPAAHKTAKKGRWVNGCADAFFNELRLRLKNNSFIIAEDLGVITSDVKEVMKKFGFPGTRVIQFGFGKDYPSSIHLPGKYDMDVVVYTGTHDNNTLRGWFEKDARAFEKKHLLNYLTYYEPVSDSSCIKINNLYGKNDNLCIKLIKVLLFSDAGLVIIPVQDLLCLDHTARMNHPSTTRSNWKWKLKKTDLDNLCEQFSVFLRKITGESKRIKIY